MSGSTNGSVRCSVAACGICACCAPRSGCRYLIPVSSRAIGVGRALDAANQADTRQADYYRRLLDAQRDYVHRRLAKADAKLAKARLERDFGTARRVQMLIRELKKERQEIYRLTTALDYRFPPTRIGIKQPQ